ncbi:MAG: helix-turn-helix domain-containing protein [Spirochaetia bacterium]|nr:helix-turn-helix domain-containing protein [Spirochaetia bacterium]
MPRMIPLKNALAEEGPRWASLFQRIRIDLVSCILWETDPLWSIEKRTVGDLMFFIPLSGALDAEVGGEKISAKRGGMFVLPPGVPHAVKHQPPFLKLQVIAIHVFVSDAAGLPLMNRFNKYFFEIPDAGYWLDAFLSLAKLWAESAPLGEKSAAALLPWFFGRMAESGYPLELSAPEIDARVARALAKIHAATKDFPTVRELAGEAELGEAQFRKIFLREVGESPKEYVIRQRLRKAVELLRTTPLRIGEIARLTGFDYGPHFHLLFRKRFGCSPATYRKRSSL